MRSVELQHGFDFSTSCSKTMKRLIDPHIRGSTLFRSLFSYQHTYRRVYSTDIALHYTLIVVDIILKILSETGCKPIAYANDIALANTGMFPDNITDIMESATKKLA